MATGQQRRLYPVGIQTFQKLREGHYLYIDKTEYVYRMVRSSSTYVFLSRPRRFGKSLLTSTLRKFNVKPDEIGGHEAKASAFDAPTETMRSVTPLLYQSGYLTIKGYDARLSLYTLDMPNKEVRLGLMESLLPNYMSGESVERATTLTARLYDAMDRGDVDKAMRLLRAFLLTISQTANTNYEGHYQQVIYIIFTLIGFYVDVEVSTASGRVDMVMRTKDTLYLIELKLNKSAEAAMDQINLKDYAARFALSGLPIVKVGINFDPERRTIGDWRIEKQG